MSDESRQYHRTSVDWPARAGRKGLGVAIGRVKNASLGGVYFVTTFDLPIGDHALIEIQIAPGDKPVLAEGKIARKQPLPVKRSGYGIQFTRIDDMSLMRLLSVLAKNAETA